MPVIAPFVSVIAFVASVVLQGPAPASTPRPRLTGVHHVAFRVTDAASARRFYGEMLGLAERKPSDGTRITYAVGHRQHVVLEPGLPAGEIERLRHVAYETTDLKALEAYLTSRGARVLRPDNRCADSAIHVMDPDGHVIEFVQGDWPPAVPGATAERALSKRLLHAGVTVRDEETAHKFYREVLGFSEIWRGGRTEGVTSWINMRVPDGTDYLEYMLTTSTPDRRQLGSSHHICLTVPDIQAAWEEVARRTQPSDRRQLGVPNVGRNGRWQLNLFDPDGTRVELMEPFRIR